MEKEKFKQEIDNWLSEVATECHKMATQPDFDVDFYVFQSDIPKMPNPKLLILGINPGGYATYTSAMERLGKGRTKNDLAQGVNTYSRKPSWEGISEGANKMRDVLVGKQFREDEKWCETVNSNSLFNSQKLFDVLDNAVVMNMFYFNTKKETDLYAMCKMEQMEYCLKKTLELIEIVNPENILLFTTSNKNLNLMKVKIKSKDGYVKEGYLGERKVYAIPHPTGYWRAYSYASREKIRAKLNKIF